MAKEKYESLIEGFCRYVGLKNTTSVLLGEPIAVDDVNCAFMYAESALPGKVFLYFDYGSLPGGREHEASVALLKQNHATYNGCGRSFGIAEDGRHVVLSDHVDLYNTSAEELAEKVIQEVERVKSWREDFFLQAQSSDNTEASQKVALENNLPHNLATQLQLHRLRRSDNLSSAK